MQNHYQVLPFFNIEVHKTCGAYGLTGVVPKATRLGPKHAYRDYGKAMVGFGFENKPPIGRVWGPFATPEGLGGRGF